MAVTSKNSGTAAVRRGDQPVQARIIYSPNNDLMGKVVSMKRSEALALQAENRVKILDDEPAGDTPAPAGK